MESNDESNSRDEEVQSDEYESNSEEDTQDKKRKQDTTQEGQSKKLKVEKLPSKLYRQPTAEEMSRLRETEQLFNSNLFRLQIDQLLDEVKMKEKYKRLFCEWFGGLKEVLESLREYEITTSDLNNKQKKKFLNNLRSTHNCSAKADQDLLIKLKKPQSCSVFGLPNFCPISGSKFKVDIAIHIPDACLLKGDYLNNRFKVKQSYYATYLYLNIKKSEISSEIKCSEAFIEMIPNFSEKIVVHLHVLPPRDYFKTTRFLPNVNNIRQNLFETPYQFDAAALKDSTTAFYNARLLHDLTLWENNELLARTLDSFNNVQDAIKLLAIWLQQRNLYDNTFGFSHTLLTQTILYLTLQRKLNKHMSSYQVVRIFWVFLSTTNWHENPISMCENVQFEDFRAEYDVVFVDSSGNYNLAAFLHYDVYMKIRSEAQLAVSFLDNITFDSFGDLFMNKMSPELQYDALLILQDSEYFKNVYDLASIGEQSRCVGFSSYIIVKTLLKLLHKGLNKRVLHIVPLSCKETDRGGLTEITFGITLDSTHAFSLIEKGPEANTPEAHEFKTFWGKLAEIRRFVDGAICEAVYFPADNVQEKRRIFQNILNFVVTQELKVEKHYIVANQFEDMISIRDVNSLTLGSCEEKSLDVIRVFDEISKELRDAKLPLVVTNVKGISQTFCYTSLYPPTPCLDNLKKGITIHKNNNTVFKDSSKYDAVPRYVEAVECVIQLGMNSKWPQNLQALRYIQLGFYIELSKYLESKKIVSSVHRDCLDVLYKGFVFRLYIHNPREITELRKYTQEDGTVAFKDTSESVALEYKLHIIPQIVGALHGVHSQYPCFGPTSCLIKQWVRAQMIDEDHIPDIVIDLLNAYLFINSAPYNNASLPQVGFLRFLKFVAHCNWQLQLIIVNFNGELTKESVDEHQSKFQQERDKFPPLAILTSYDYDKFVSSRNCTVEILNRLATLANCTCAIVQRGISESNLVVDELFVPNLQGYNAIIRLHNFLNAKRSQNVVIKQDALPEKIPIVNFSPVENYLKELRHYYGSYALFFHNSYGGNVIGVLWKPHIFESKPFKVSNIEGRKVHKKHLVLNEEAIIEDFAILGNGLVQSVKKVS
ncbi:hypothetical protein PPYR_02511 [Photinus pyralis]|uniref:Nucleolar protein 6 n=1 Tax=Photinus pyralis TaxID=7054 RepID=A0A1Y1JYS2_PHOPY|nr:nucleolar protein 6 isoform X2 [Photinus pyralis]KAB0805541.1 hypothetical protein PPYR_02511 [Photinus pyralis]